MADRRRAARGLDRGGHVPAPTEQRARGDHARCLCRTDNAGALQGAARGAAPLTGREDGACAWVGAGAGELPELIGPPPPGRYRPRMEEGPPSSYLLLGRKTAG